ncbi:MAG TPA: hypothetical protein VIG24_09540 [Acidimicrobiia bacterium]
MEATATTNPTEEVTMSTARTITLCSDLPMRGGITIPAGTELATSTEALRSLATGLRLAPQISPTLSVEHPLYEGALLAIPGYYIDGWLELIGEALQLTR